MDSSVIFPKCARKCLLKIILPFACANKKPRVEEEVDDGGHQPRMGGGDSNWAEQLSDNISRIPRLRSIEVTFGANSGDPIDDYHYHHEYGRPTRGMPLPVPPHAPLLPPPPAAGPRPLPPRAMLPPRPDYDYGPPGPFMGSRHHACGYPRGAPPLAYYDDYW